MPGILLVARIVLCCLATATASQHLNRRQDSRDENVSPPSAEGGSENSVETRILAESSTTIPTILSTHTSLPSNSSTTSNTASSIPTTVHVSLSTTTSVPNDGLGDINTRVIPPGVIEEPTGATSIPIFSTLTPPCAGFLDPFVRYVTLTVTSTDTVTLSDTQTVTDSAAKLVLPTPFCDTSVHYTRSATIHTYFGGATAAPPSFPVVLTTSYVSATVKTTEYIPQVTSPAILWGPTLPTGAEKHDGQNGVGPTGQPSSSSPSAYMASSTPMPTDYGTGPQSTGLGHVICSIWGCSGGPSGTPATDGNGEPFPGNQIPDSPPGATPVQVNHVPVAVFPTGVIVGQSTYAHDQTGTSTDVINGQTFIILPSGQGVVAPGGMTITAPPEGGVTPYPTVVLDGNTFSADPANPSQILIDGLTLARPGEGSSSTISINGHMFTIGASEIAADGTTMALPSTRYQDMEWMGSTIDGIAFDIGASFAIVDGETIPIGAGAPMTTLTMNGETVTLGPEGIIFPGTTIAPLSPSAAGMPYYADASGVTIEAYGDFFSFAPTDVVIDGTTYDYANPTDVVVGGGKATISIGPSGVDLQTTTGAPPHASSTSDNVAARSIFGSGLGLVTFLAGLFAL